MKQRPTTSNILSWLGFVTILVTGCSVVNAPDEARDPGTGGDGNAGVGGTGGMGGMPPECEEDADCETDDDPCTLESCNAEGSCEVTTVDPDDGDACTADTCDEMGNPVNEPIDLDDDDLCTFDLCDPDMGEAHPTEIVVFEEDFSTASDWTANGQWQIGAAKPSPISQNPAFEFAHDPPKDHTMGMDNQLAGVVIGGFADVSTVTPVEYLESPAFDGSAPEGALVLSYWRYLASDFDPFMANTVEVYDGSAWQTVFATGGSPEWHDSGWTRVSHEITEHANPNMKIRFGFGVTQIDAWSDAPSWSLDDVRVRRVPVYNDDDDACTLDTCDPQMGAVNTPIDLDDMDPCTEDLCDAERGVTHHDTSIRFWADFGYDDSDTPYDSDSFNPTNEWEVGKAPGSPDPPMDTSPTDENRIAGVNLGGDYDVSTLHGYHYITSDVFDGTQTTPGSPLELTFQRWLVSDYTPYVNNRIEVYDGTTWQVIWESGAPPGINDTSWQAIMHDISALSASNMRVRFGFNVDNSSAIAEAGWNIDDVKVRDTTCDNL